MVDRADSAKEVRPQQVLDTLISGLDSGFMDLSEVQDFADAVLAGNEPLSPQDLQWLAEASTATCPQTLLGELWSARRRYGSEERYGQCGWTDAYIGLLVLRSERDGLELRSLLQLLGAYVDGHEHPIFDCELFYALLTRSEQGGGAEEIARQLRDLTEHQRECARKELRTIGFSESGRLERDRFDGGTS